MQFEKAGVSLGGGRILTDLDLTLSPGEALGVMGPNGSGKTTLIRAVATLIKTDAGRTAVLGVDPTKEDLTDVRRAIGLIGHQPVLINELTLFENLDHFARLGDGDREKVPRVLEVVGLAEVANRRASACSFGMQRRAEIAHLLLSKPTLLLLDEAASGLDDAARELVEALVRSVRGRGGAAIVVSHDRGALESLCDEIASLEHGRLEGGS